MKNIRQYPLLPLRDTVIFPRNVASLFVGREKSMEATRLAMESNRMIVLSSQKETDVILPQKDDLSKTSVLCEILQLLKMPDGTYKILVEGIQRVSIVNFHDHENYSEVEVENLTSLIPQADHQANELLNKQIEEIVHKFTALNERQSLANNEFVDEINKKNDSEYIIDSVAQHLPLLADQKQDVLDTLDILERAEKINIALDSQLEISHLENNIHERVRGQMDKMQRQYYLNEQMRVIREELGEEDGDEFETYRKKIEEKNLPQEVDERAKQELNKMEKMPPMAAESTIVRNYLDWILDLPWSESSQDNRSISKAEEILEESHYGLEKVKDRILEFVAVRQLNQETRGPILCLVGPPGVGKTSLAKSLADCLDRKFARIALGGVRDEAEIRGHRRTYIGALPGRILNALKRLKVNNPVILLDEIDKMSSDFRGNPAAALLEVLDPEQNKEFTDHYIELPFDLSQVLFIATANVAHSVPEALLDRLELIELGGYTEAEKINIAKRFLIPRQLKENGVEDVDLRYSAKSLAYIIRHYTKEAGVRQLERELARIMRKIAREHLHRQESLQQAKTQEPQAAELTGEESPETYETKKTKEAKEQKPENKTAPILLERNNIHRYLGAPKFNYGKKEKDVAIGKCHGLAWTAAGGDLMNIEVALAYGKGNLSLTGNLGDVMKESANTALGYVRSQAHELGLATDFFEKTDIFVHVPEGAIPKDGPSAGITLATAILSAVTQIPIKNQIAMTGEITLRGNVLPIGGLKEKVLAAFRGGINEIICPEENEKDLENIPQSIQERVTFHFVSNIRQVIHFALVSSQNIFQEAPNAYPFSAGHLTSAGKEISRQPM